MRHLPVQQCCSSLEVGANAAREKERDLPGDATPPMSHTPGDPLISILMPCYRGLKYLDEAVQSCLNQTQRDFELICVDDKSPDGTLAFLHRIAKRDSRIRVIAREGNGGQGRAFQTALEASRGRYITRLAQDDVFYPNALKTMLEELERHPEAGMTYCDMLQIDSEGNVLYTMTTEEPERALLPRCRVGLCVMWRKEVHRLAGGFTPDTYAEDYDMWLQISIHYPILKAHGDPQLGFRLHGGQASNESRKHTVSSRMAHLHYNQTLARLSPWSIGYRYKTFKAHAHILLHRLQDATSK